jgi:hypothetical protein
MVRLVAGAVITAGAVLVASACSSSVMVSADRAADFRTCALLSACEQGSFPGFGAICEFEALVQGPLNPNVIESPETAHAVHQCYARATDCAGIKACLAATPALAAACAGANRFGLCVGNVAVWCAPFQAGFGPVADADLPVPSAFDCGAVGLVCGQDSINAMCGTATCDATTMPHCEGDSVVACFRGALQSEPCNIVGPAFCTPGPSGRTCSEQAWDTCAAFGGGVGCVATGAVCDESTFETACDGSSIVTCSHGRIGRFDCTSLGLPLTCRIAPDRSAACAANATECDSVIAPSDLSELGVATPETCADGVITFCYFGHKTTVDCRSFGLSGCTATNTAPAKASCTP